MIDVHFFEIVHNLKTRQQIFNKQIVKMASNHLN